MRVLDFYLFFGEHHQIHRNWWTDDFFFGLHQILGKKSFILKKNPTRQILARENYGAANLTRDWKKLDTPDVDNQLIFKIISVQNFFIFQTLKIFLKILLNWALLIFLWPFSYKTAFTDTNKVSCSKHFKFLSLR